MIKNIHYYQLPDDFMPELISFVIQQNNLHHGGGVKDFEAEKSALCEEEAQYDDSHIFVARSEGHLCGSIRVFKKGPDQQLPMEKLYPIKVDDWVGAGCSIYHIGRFAIRQGIDQQSFRIFKTLMVLALNVSTQDKDGTVFAECDRKLLRTIRLLGIEAEAIGTPIHYLGSETIPIQLPWGGYQNFLNENRSLLEDEIPLFGSAGSGMELQL